MRKGATMSYISLFEERDHTQDYLKYRPIITEHIIDRLMSFLRTQFPEQEGGRFPLALDVGCGTGHQSTIPLSKHFEIVTGIDISKAQVDMAMQSQHPANVQFIQSSYEPLPLKDESAYLIQAANCLHWLDRDIFYKECNRVLVPGGVIAAYCYHYPTCRVADDHPNAHQVNEVMEEISNITVERGYTHERHNLVKEKFTDPSFKMPFPEQCTSRIDDIILHVPTTLSGFLGFLHTVSSFRKMIQEERDWAKKWYNDVVERLMKACGMESVEDEFTYQMSVFMILGHKPK